MDPSRLNGVEFVLPVITGSIAFFLGSKSSQFVTHKWTVYVRHPNNEDLSHIIQKVTFTLHSSFNNPVRVLEQQPFELTESGWGEFEVGVTLHLTPDAGEKDIELLHRLRLYEDDDPEGKNQTPKKPVVSECVDEVVFVAPRAQFYNRVAAHLPRPAPQSQLGRFYLPHTNEDSELHTIQAIRHKLEQQMSQISS